jgi:hypothetical protein
MAEYRLDYRISLLTAGTAFPSLPERMRLTEHGPAYQIIYGSYIHLIRHCINSVTERGRLNNLEISWGIHQCQQDVSRHT